MPRQTIKLFFSALALILTNACRKNEELAKSSEVEVLFEKSKADSIDTKTRLDYINAALGKLSENEFDSLALAMLYNKSYCHYKLQEPDSSHTIDAYTFRNAVRLDNRYYIARTARDLGIHFEKKQEFDSAFFYHNISKNNFLYLKDSVEVGRRLLRQGIIQKNQNDFFGAKETLVESLRFLETDSKYRAIVYNELGTIHRKLSNPEDARVYFERAISSSLSSSDIIAYKNNLAILYTELGEFESAINQLQDLLENSDMDQESARYARVLDNLAYSRWSQDHRYGNIDFFQALRIRKEVDDRRGQIASYSHLGEFYAAKDPVLSKSYLDTAIQISRQLKIPVGESDALALLMKNQPDNMVFKDRYIFLRDSLYARELRVKTQFAKMKYDDEQEKNRILLLENETYQKQVALVEEKNQKIILLSLSVLLFLGGLFYYKLLRQRHRREKLREVYSTEKRISKKIHDELANDIYGIMARIEHSGTLGGENTLIELESIYNRTRDISHTTGDIKTDDFKSELKRLISLFNGGNTNIITKGINDIEWGKLNEEKKITLYRVINELLVNMKKHSEASLVSIQFIKIKNKLRVNYVDNGKGVIKPIDKSSGLLNTENRIKNMKGTFSFDSEPGKGVTVKFTLPI
ncbi:ATP-binding protein [Maribacter cobaltidurans]|uniref:histidine kinase n=1 Tax=Maribacter cobaltidurans TaxID=1178778 RepID=A0A223V5W9_9FLAO|nr:tetratricopeptide repeat-containing sensor histidine kinase [Maribacter cobaltidurans]ASV30815.1 hypothetical protein CJ263_11630 [Maribacter cobaltidurans]GGD81976.1 two-component sensor histidine kinase [Maribacter cobaltidurans]